jgi:hypothetical protein
MKVKYTLLRPRRHQSTALFSTFLFGQAAFYYRRIWLFATLPRPMPSSPKAASPRRASECPIHTAMVPDMAAVGPMSGWLWGEMASYTCCAKPMAGFASWSQ